MYVCMYVCKHLLITKYLYIHESYCIDRLGKLQIKVHSCTICVLCVYLFIYCILYSCP
jgi:hypothetical protein